MSLEILLAATVFAVVMTFTPGPNNIMLMTSALNFGFRRTLPHVFGVFLGFGFMVVLVGLGLGGIFKVYPLLLTILKYVGAAYMIWLAWMIGKSDGVEEGKSGSRPLTFVEGAAFQWVNFKGWIAAVTAVSAYAGLAAFPWNVLLLAFIFTVAGAGSSTSWAAFGSALRRVIRDPLHIKLFNFIMAVLLIASLYPVFKDGVW